MYQKASHRYCFSVSGSRDVFSIFGKGLGILLVLAANWENSQMNFASGGILKSHRPSVHLSIRQSVRPLQIVSQRYLINY